MVVDYPRGCPWASTRSELRPDFKELVGLQLLNRMFYAGWKLIETSRQIDPFDDPASLSVALLVKGACHLKGIGAEGSVANRDQSVRIVRERWRWTFPFLFPFLFPFR